MEQVLLTAVTCGLLVLMVTPLVVTPSTFFPFVVGKAVFARSVIEVVVALWALLALLVPAYRPRRSLVLVLMGAGLAWSVVSAVLGASPQRSFWSNYERMQGVIDATHWAALVLVVACVLRKPGQWVVLLNGNLSVGVVVAGLTIFQYFGVPDVPFFGDFLKQRMVRPSSTLGNPIYLGNYMVLNAIVAIGLLARSCLPNPAAPVEGRGRRSRQKRSGNGSRKGTAFGNTTFVERFVLAVWYVTCGAVQLWAGILATSRGPLLGAIFGVMVLALVSVLLARSRRSRVIGLSAFAALALLGTSPLLIKEVLPQGFMKAIDSKVARRLIRLDFNDRTLQTRWIAWRTGLEGFADRPVAGWGPENFLVSFARYGEDLPAKMKPHDTAHGALVEKFANEGSVGGALYLALWAVACVRLVRAARVARGRDRVLVLTVGTALAAHVATMQTLFATAVGSMQLAMLLGFVAGLETESRPAPEAAGSKRRFDKTRLAALGALWCLVAAGLWTNQRIHAGAKAYLRTLSPPKASTLARARYQQAIDAFEPLANLVRIHLFEEFHRRLYQEPGLVESTMPWLEQEVAAGLRTEPDNWRLRLGVARLYGAAAERDPAFLPRAQAEARNLLRVAPRKRGVLSLHGRPTRIGPVQVKAVPEGLLLDWPRRGFATLYRMARRHGRGRWEVTYEGTLSQAVVAPHGKGRSMFRVRGCLGLGNCGPWSRRVVVDVVPSPGDPVQSGSRDATRAPSGAGTADPSGNLI